MEVNKITKKVRLDHYDLVKYQIITEVMFFKKENIVPSDLELLTLLGLWGPIELRLFCDRASGIVYKHTVKPEVRSQNVRNRMVSLEKRGYVIKSRKGKKIIQLVDGLGIAKRGNILLNYNFLAVEANQEKSNSKEDSREA